MIETKFEKQSIDRFTFISEKHLNILKDNNIKTLGQLSNITRTNLINYGFEIGEKYGDNIIFNNCFFSFISYSNGVYNNFA